MAPLRKLFGSRPRLLIIVGVVGLLLLGFVAAPKVVNNFDGSFWPPGLRWPWGPPPEEPPFQPVELPADYKATLTLWDYPWPLWRAVEETGDFLPADTDFTSYQQLLAAAIARFQHRYPGIAVEVHWLSFAEGPGRLDAAVADGQAPDVAAVWWHGPPPETGDLVPVSPYLPAAEEIDWHPLAWRLAALPRYGDVPGAGQAGHDDNVIWAWPRWLNHHYWLERIPSVDEEVQPAFLPGGSALPLLAELLATAPADNGEETEVPDGTAGEKAALIEMLHQLRDELPAVYGTGAGAAALVRGDITLAGGLGPALAAWPFLPPPGAAEPPAADGYRLVPPPGGSPVFSLGGYVVPRPGGEIDLARVQGAMELARFLSEQLSVEPLGRQLAVPAALDQQARWRQTTPLPAETADQLQRAADLAAQGQFRLYPPPLIRPFLLPEEGRELNSTLEKFWQGDADAAEVVDLLWPPE